MGGSIFVTSFIHPKPLRMEPNFEFTENEKALAKNTAMLAGSIIAAIPGDKEKKQAVLKLIAEEVNTLEDAATEAQEKPVKAISDNLTATLHSVHDVLPDSEEPAKQRAKARFKNAVNIVEGILNMIGL